METKVTKPVFDIKAGVSTNALATTSTTLTPFGPGVLRIEMINGSITSIGNVQQL